MNFPLPNTRAIAAAAGRIRAPFRELGVLVLPAVVLIAAALLAFFVLPSLVVSANDLRAHVAAPPGAAPAPAPTAVDLVQARNGARTAAVALIAGIGAALAAMFAARTYYLSRQTDARARYTTAIEQLRSPQEVVRVSAIGELELIAADPAYHRRVMEVLATFLREHHRTDNDENPPGSVQDACTVLARRRAHYDRGLVLNLMGADLREVHIEPRANLRGALLSDAKLRGAYLRQSDLRDADLRNAMAAGVRLEDAKLAGAVLDGAQLQGATLNRVTTSEKTTFEDVTLDKTYFRGADLRKATGLPLKDGTLVGAVTDGAQLPS